MSVMVSLATHEIQINLKIDKAHRMLFTTLIHNERRDREESGKGFSAEI